MSLGDEKERVAAVAELLADAPAEWRAGEIVARLVVSAADRDDAAVVDVSGPSTLVVASDYIRGVKFALYEAGYLSYYDLGWYLAVANLSDMAAMGAVPLGLLTVVRYPDEMADSEFLEVMKGVRDAARGAGATVLGGDSGSAERLILSGAAIGIAEQGRVLRRDSAEPGDVLCITGSIGAPAAAIVHFTLNEVAVGEETKDELLKAWRRPEARISQGRTLARSGCRVACQDVSDGLRSTVLELAAASGVGVIVDGASIPIDLAARAVAERNNVDGLALAMSASVDFELLFTVPPACLDAVRAAFQRESQDLYVIGEIVEGADVVLRDLDGALVPLPGVEWRHQREGIASVILSGARRGSSTEATES